MLDLVSFENIGIYEVSLDENIIKVSKEGGSYYRLTPTRDKERIESPEEITLRGVLTDKYNRVVYDSNLSLMNKSYYIHLLNGEVSVAETISPGMGYKLSHGGDHLSEWSTLVCSVRRVSPPMPLEGDKKVLETYIQLRSTTVHVMYTGVIELLIYLNDVIAGGVNFNAPEGGPIRDEHGGLVGRPGCPLGTLGCDSISWVSNSRDDTMESNGHNTAVWVDVDDTKSGMVYLTPVNYVPTKRQNWVRVHREYSIPIYHALDYVMDDSPDQSRCVGAPLLTDPVVFKLDPKVGVVLRSTKLDKVLENLGSFQRCKFTNPGPNREITAEFIEVDEDDDTGEVEEESLFTIANLGVLEAVAISRIMKDPGNVNWNLNKIKNV